MNFIGYFIGWLVLSTSVFGQYGSGFCVGDGGSDSLRNYRFSFEARAEESANQVQIWAGFRVKNRFDKYMVGIKGGLQDDLYLMRLGYMGNDEFMGVRPLGFHPVQCEWYKLTVEACEGRIRVFVGEESVPHIDITDPNWHLADCGKVVLGGGWIPTEYRNLTITPMEADALAGIPRMEYERKATAAEKESLRALNRGQYKPINITVSDHGRTETSLNGCWLFMPDYQLSDKETASSPDCDDTQWHVMNVPDFWNPIRIWLHGETMPSPGGPQPKGVSDTYYQKETDRCDAYTFDWRRTKSAWYRQWMTLPENISGKRTVITFDAVSKVAEVYVNGTLAATHIGMFGSFEADVTGMLHSGKNLITVKVTRDFIKEIDDADKVIDVSVTVPVTNKMLKDIAHGFYQGDPAGIWQPVKLVVTDPLKIEDVFIKPTLDGATFDMSVSNVSAKGIKFDIGTGITDRETGSVLYEGTDAVKLSVGGQGRKDFSYTVSGLKPRIWSPGHPNLYDFHFEISSREESDAVDIVSGFRTFEIKDGLFWLNGHKYWLRGGNHTPFALAPNDRQLAETFFTLMKEGNIDITRTHTTPWNELWMELADEKGIGVSFEGSWPWLMIHSTPLPDENLITLWREEFLELLKKYRNHPSLLFWTVNNEMKFYDNDSNLERAKEKFTIISDVVRLMRETDPTRPICFDSNYQSKGKAEKFGSDFMASVDDGDIDDVHGYYNWYDYSLFRFFNGEFQQRFKMPGRPLISQEMSTGYPNNETGHPTRSYQLIHQNPMSLVGYQGYDWADPAAFLKVQSFITGELAEALRRSNPDASGIFHFALLTWFRQVYDSQNIEPYPTYYALQRALQPVLVSAELWGRHLYCGARLPLRICVVNDREDGNALQPTILRWEFRNAEGKVLSRGSETVPVVEHYGRRWLEPEITVPQIPGLREDAQLVLKLTENGVPVSENQYDILIASRAWVQGEVHKAITTLAPLPELDSLGVEYRTAASVGEMLKTSASLYIVPSASDCSDEEAQTLRKAVDSGAKVLFLGSKEVARKVFPEYISGWIIPTEGDIAFMERSDSPLFDGIGELELRYFNNGRREIPLVCDAALKTLRCEAVTELAGQMKIHAYIDEGTPQERINRISSMRGFTLVRISSGKGSALVSTFCTSKAVSDPIAAKLLMNMIMDLCTRNTSTVSFPCISAMQKAVYGRFMHQNLDYRPFGVHKCRIVETYFSE